MIFLKASAASIEGTETLTMSAPASSRSLICFTVASTSVVSVLANTETTDVEATVKQINDLEEAGADIVRVSVPSMEAAEAFKNIKQLTNIPLVSDIHFDHKIALKVMEYGVDCVRINPGNIGSEKKIKEVIDVAKDKNIPLRVGVNAGPH